MELASDITTEDLQAFLQEADEQLQLLDEDIVRLEREQDNQDLLQEIFRAAHTLKGSSAMLGHQVMAEMAHAMESVLDRVRKGTLGATTPVIDALLHSLDMLNTLKEQLVNSTDQEVDISATVSELEQAAGTEESGTQSDLRGAKDDPVTLSQEARDKLRSLVESGQRAYLIQVEFAQGTVWAAVRSYQILDELEAAAEVLGSFPSKEDIEAERVDSYINVIVTTQQAEAALRTAVASVEDVDAIEIIAYEEPDEKASDSDATPHETADTTQRQRGQQAQTVRIDVERLDDLMNMIGELVIDRTRIVQIGKELERKYRDDEFVEALGITSAHIEKVVNELQEATMKVRMLPIGTVFNGFPRMIRDLAQSLNKKVDFVVDGQDTEIDRTVVEHIRDPLVHLLRNAVDHGLESPEERRAAGKSEMGTVRLSASHEQGHIVITVEDDGGGIDPERIKKAAVQKGQLSAEAASRLTEAEAIDLIFLPGASTAEKTTEVSGRGVGMDIVKSNIAAINGFVNIDTKIGEGTKFTLKLPLTLATLQALLVSVGNTTYAVPLVYVLETVKLAPDDIQTVEGVEVLRPRGSVIPLIRLTSVLGIKPTESSDDSTWVVIVRFGEKRVGLAVDALVELQEIVVKSLGQYIGDVKGVAGASILGDGTVVLILDVLTLLNLIAQK